MPMELIPGPNSIVSTPPAMDSSNRAASTEFVTAATRERLTAARTYYVRTDGSDSNNGLTNSAGGAFLTSSKALSVISGNIDFGGQTVTIQFGDGTRTPALALVNWVGGGSLTITGENTTGTIFSGGLTCAVILGGQVTVQKLKVTNSGSVALSHTGIGQINIGADFEIGTATYQYQVGAGGARVVGMQGYTVSAGAFVHWFIHSGGYCQFEGGTITVSGTPAWTGYGLYCYRAGLFRCTATFSGSATGVRYQVENGGFADVVGAGVNYLPGNAAGAGTNLGTSPYGSYA